MNSSRMSSWSSFSSFSSRTNPEAKLQASCGQRSVQCPALGSSTTFAEPTFQRWSWSCDQHHSTVGPPVAMTQTRRTTSRTTSRTHWLLPLLFFCWLALTRSSEDEAHKQSLFQQLIHHGNGLRARHATTPTLAPTLPADASFKHQRRLRKRKHKLHRPRHKPG